MSVDTSVNISTDTSIQYPTKNSREYLPQDVYNWGGRGKGDISESLLPNVIPRGGLALPEFPGLFEKSSFKMADSQSKNSNESILFRRDIDQYSLKESA